MHIIHHKILETKIICAQLHTRLQKTRHHIDMQFVIKLFSSLYESSLLITSRYKYILLNYSFHKNV